MKMSVLLQALPVPGRGVGSVACPLQRSGNVGRVFPLLLASTGMSQGSGGGVFPALSSGTGEASPPRCCPPPWALRRGSQNRDHGFGIGHYPVHHPALLHPFLPARWLQGQQQDKQPSPTTF